MSAVYEIGNKFLKVNGDKISSPYVINAIGNADYLKSAVSGKGGGVDELKELGHETSVDTSKKARYGSVHRVVFNYISIKEKF